ncbi:tRNA uridine-5-carboxymethylaminomethyl(34) synthesis GTPase MnmE [Campylobacter canadensis]|uniref:tRNA modification GTPase MnmE n=1 Tax=Campylobacter canadensis TaxID=449520 RepID=A0ABS7WQI8_9BACT|nr:tRNA uridine-5-carboxymethylaminomethyl(34) synthesis GTPase MnmE [Campylobacter canadensis]MBZ7987030.1 tRNA uridine-5-carboxymethylaminomethyl(34) synthesis GTPase MnmE [Campylobacter canadensis]MBZ7994644.1 tRNA uridine-5-carboxymethylaminomethyl(34) synthesis GTPase MnmE [Campylobacter canadensis]MBZ7996140.1 tRNA uridine-5-carboxymethylaminomethyl(34) synthesis GTPase MnmE [Campylobacter canadensis]MBZ7998066.1 tRNA uridine-5-carboxymethylaminomethyl(34) synthesis GTPase MnmE [Campyloba
MSTIAALATAGANSAINIIRLSGEQALEYSLNLFKDKDKDKLNKKPRYAHFLKLFINNEFFDEAIVIYFKAPFSFTGEDVVEFHIHGGIVNAQSLLFYLYSIGVKAAKPGEFSKRACLNNKMSLEKAILINELINAKSNNARKIISKNIDGAFKQIIMQTQDEIIKTLAFIETAIDYADDDLPSDILENAKNMLFDNAKKLEKIAEQSQKKKALIEGYTLAIIGLPNAGKSSLLNAILNSNRAIVSDIAGTTRDSIEELINYNGHLLKLIDTAGIRNSNDEIEKIGVDKSYESINKADLIIFLSDASRKLLAEEEELIKYIKNTQKDCIYVLNKCDLNILNSLEAVKISAKNKDIDELLNALNNFLNSSVDNELILTSSSLIQAFNDASKAIFNACDVFLELELCAFYLNQALNVLNIFGKNTNSDDLFDAMFSNFCLGK